MDIGELLSFKPDVAPKRSNLAMDGRGDDDEDDEKEFADDPNDSYEARAAKRRKRVKAENSRKERANNIRRANEAEQMVAAASAAAQDPRIKQLQEEGDDDEGEGSGELDETAMKKLVLAFEKKALKNQELRIKFPDEPQKFMMSEVELHDAVQDLRALATTPDLYPGLVELRCVASFVGLLSHENTDIVCAVIDLVQELTDVDALHESEEGADALIETLISNQIAALLVQCMDRLNESVREESDGVHNALSIFENIVEVRPAICKDASEVGLLGWLMKKLKVKVPFDNNKLFASEILSIFLQNEPENRAKYGEMGSAIDSLLQQLAYYKRHNPNTAEEMEMMENLFNCLCSLLLHTPNREKFLRGEGLQLMNLMLREKKESRNGALKVLDHALTGPEGKDNCAKFVDILGLRTIFPLFMKTPKRSKRKGVSAEEHEEHVIAIVASLMKNCKGAQRQRLVSKFTESDHEKVERLMELHFKYLDKVQAADERAQNEDEDEDEAYIRRLDNGLFSLQLVDYIIAEACASGAASVKQRVQKILTQRNASVTTIRNVIREYAGNLGETAATDTGAAGDSADSTEPTDQEARNSERQYLLHLVNKF